MPKSFTLLHKMAQNYSLGKIVEYSGGGAGMFLARQIFVWNHKVAHNYSILKISKCRLAVLAYAWRCQNESFISWLIQKHKTFVWMAQTKHSPSFSPPLKMQHSCINCIQSIDPCILDQLYTVTQNSLFVRSKLF